MNGCADDGAVLVTGAARRIGAALARGLARAGRPVVLHASARSLAEAEAAAVAIRAQGGRAAALACDLADAGATALLVDRAAAVFGPLTLLVNNASRFEPDEASNFTVDGYERHMAVNLRAPLQLSQSFAAGLPQGGAGAIVNVLDQRVFRPAARDFTYTLSKSALWTATRTMAQAFAPRIRVNAVGPGPVLPNDHVGDAGFAEEIASLPLGEAVAVESVVAAVLYLALARHVTGQMIAVDGGQHLV